MSAQQGQKGKDRKPENEAVKEYRINDWIEQKDILSKRFVSLKNRHTANKDKIEELQKENDGLNKQAEKLNNELQNSVKQIEILSSTPCAQEDDLATIQAEKDALTEEIKGLKLQLEGATKLIQDLETETKQLLEE